MSRNFELLQRAEQESSTTVESDRDRTVSQSTFANGADVLGQEISKAQELPDVSRTQIYKIVQRLIASAQGGKLCVVFSGTERGTGCTWLAAHVGNALAAVSRRSVCLIDTTQHGRGLDGLFNVSNHHGFTDAVAQSAPLDDFLHRLNDNLWLLTAGSQVTPASLLSADKIATCISKVRAAFDYVIIDTAPLSASSTQLALASAADGIVLVLKANASRREIAHKMLQEMATANLRLVGAILNQRTFPVPHRIYKHL